MSQSDLHHLSAAYALDALDGDERAAFEAHYPTCEICSREVEEFRATAAVLATDVEAEPPPDLRARILFDVSRSRQLSPLADRHGAGSRGGLVGLDGRRRRLRPERILLGAAAATVVVAATMAALLVRPAGDVGGDLGELVAAPDAMVTSLDPVDGAPAGTGATLRVVWSRERSEVGVLGNDVAGAGPRSVYALWILLADGGVAPAGLFEPDATGTVRVVLPLDLDGGVGWGVTVEPEGGSDTPTLPILFDGEV